MAESLFEQAKRLEVRIGAVLSGFDIDDLPKGERELVVTIKHGIVDARLDARDYEYAETRAEQLELVKEARERLEALRQAILKASEYNLFSAVDVAQFSGGIEQLIAAVT